MMTLSPDNLRTFVAAAQALNFTQAAKKVNLTQSAVSMQINRLESDLGKSLFRRITRGVVLTRDGEALLKYARRLLRLHDEALAYLTGPDVEGELKLGAPEDLAYGILPRILKGFAARYPLVRIDLHCDLSDRLRVMVENKALDLCLCTGKGETDGGDFLRNEPLVWIGPRDGAPELESPLPLALFHDGCIYRQWALEALTREGIAYRIAYSSPSIAGILAAVRSGMAVAPVGGSIPPSDFRILTPSDGEGLTNLSGIPSLPGLPSASISLHRAEAPEGEARSCLVRHIFRAFRAIPGV